MLVKLIGYEFQKKWNTGKYVLGAFVVLQLLLLMITRFFLSNDMAKMMIVNNNGMGVHSENNIGITMGLTILLYFVLGFSYIIYPFIDGIGGFNKDLSGKQAPLELMIPAISWKKIASKLIATTCTTILCLLIAALSICLFFFIKFSDKMMDLISYFGKAILSSPGNSIFVTSYFLFSFASLFMAIFFCIAFSKAISHKNKIAVPISIGIFIAYVVALGIIEMKIENFPIFQYSLFGIEYSLSTTILDILVFILAFIGTSWLVEKKIEN